MHIYHMNGLKGRWKGKNGLGVRVLGSEPENKILAVDPLEAVGRPV